MAISRRNSFSPNTKRRHLRSPTASASRPKHAQINGQQSHRVLASASTLYGYNNERAIRGQDDGHYTGVWSPADPDRSRYGVDIKFDNGLIYTTSGRSSTGDGTLRGTSALEVTRKLVIPGPVKVASTSSRDAKRQRPCALLTSAPSRRAARWASLARAQGEQSLRWGERVRVSPPAPPMFVIQTTARSRHQTHQRMMG